MQNLTAKPTVPSLDDAINTMDYDGQFTAMLETVSPADRADLIADYQAACEITDDRRRNIRKFAIILSMYGN